MKKTIFIISIIMIVITLGITKVNAATTTAELKASSETVKHGDTFTVTLHVECQDGINGIIGNKENDGFEFSYDNTKLELVKREAKILTDANDGYNTIALAYLGTNIITQEDVYEWTFKVKSDAEAGSTQITTTDLVISGLEDSETSINPLSVTIQINNAPIQQDPSEQEDTSEQIETNKTEQNTTEVDTSEKSLDSSAATTTSGKSIDGTTSTKALPKAGLVVVKGLIFISLIAVAVYTYRKVKLYKEL